MKINKCKIDGCDNEVLARSLCGKHYREYRKINNPKKCKVENCNNSVLAKELCAKHYKQFTETGKILKRTKFDMNNIKISDDIAYIDIYNINREVSCRAIIDSSDIDKIKNIKWRKLNDGNIYNSSKAISLSKAVLGKPKLEKGYVIVHKDGDLLNYRKENLVITKTNRRNNKFSNNTSGRKGVYKLNVKGVFTGKYLVYITVNKKTKYLGKRDNFEDAVKLREDAEKELGWLET